MITEDDVRRIALSLPATTERPSHSTPGFRVKDRLFARIREEGDVLVVWVDEQAELLTEAWYVRASKRLRAELDRTRDEADR